MSKIYLVNGHKKLDETVEFSEPMTGDVYSSQHTIPAVVAFQLANLQGQQSVNYVPDLNVHSVPLNNYSVDFNLHNLINSNRRTLVRDLKRVSSFIDSKTGEDAIIVLNRPHFDGLHYFLFQDIPFPVTEGKAARINSFNLDFNEHSETLVANSNNFNSIHLDSLTDAVNKSYGNMRWKTQKFDY